ncbi:hypothetical protein ABW21_db0208826 [Orbilia brochopaga]|nr:hypothetical protein ABW21_db0208826 [Drechslerella brochopaga]
MPTPPRTPPELRARTGSVGSGNASAQSLHVVSPMPQSPTSPKNINLGKPYPNATSRLRNIGINIPFCDSPDREHAVLISSNPSSTPTTIRALDTSSRNNTPSEPSSATQVPRSSPESEEFEDSATWQARWAATLERKVTPPMPGFEVGPLESMRRMREERERQQQEQQQKVPEQQQQQPQVHARTSDTLVHQDQQGLLISNTSWIAEESDNESIILDYANDHGHSYSGPATPTASEAPSRSRISEIIDEIAEGLVTGMV